MIDRSANLAASLTAMEVPCANEAHCFFCSVRSSFDTMVLLLFRGTDHQGLEDAFNYLVDFPFNNVQFTISSE